MSLAIRILRLIILIAAATALFSFENRAEQAVPAAVAPMQVVLLGTGFPRPSADRAGPSAAIVIGDKTFVVDAGRGVVMRLTGAKLPLDSVQCVFLTHLHSDHIDDLPDLYNTPWILGRAKPFELYGPEGTREIADAMQKFFAADIHIRADLTEMHPREGARINVHIVHEGIVYEDSGVRVTAFAVDHRPVEPAFGYRFDSGGRAIVISGDTRPSDNLIHFAKGADVLVHEAYLEEYFSHSDSPEVAARLRAYHTTAEQAGQVATAAGVKLLVLTHLIPGDNDAEFLRRASQTFKGRIEVGHDLDRY
jgi:ribonuclease Z